MGSAAFCFLATGSQGRQGPAATDNPGGGKMQAEGEGQAAMAQPGSPSFLPPAVGLRVGQAGIGGRGQPGKPIHCPVQSC